MFELILPQNPMEKYEEKQYLEYLFKNYAKKIEENIDMTYMCWYFIKNSFKTQWEKYKEKMIWNIIDCKLI